MTYDVDRAEAALLHAVAAAPEVPLAALLQQYAALPGHAVGVVPARAAVDAKLRARSAVLALQRLLAGGAVRLWVVDHWDTAGTAPREHALGAAIRTDGGAVSLVPVVQRATGPAVAAAALAHATVGGLQRLAPAYLLLQALAIAAWWLVLWLVPVARPPFVVGDWPETTLLAFALPDVLVLVAGSFAAAYGLRVQRAWARPVLWLVAGAVLYATLWCLGAVVVTGAGWLSAAMMVACAAAMAVVVAVVR